MAVCKPPALRWPWDPVFLEPHEVSALKGIPQLAHDAMLKLCGVGTNPFTAGGEDGRRTTEFACGKLWVGHTLRDIRAMKLPSPERKDQGPHAVPIGPPPGEQ